MFLTPAFTFSVPAVSVGIGVAVFPTPTFKAVFMSKFRKMTPAKKAAYKKAKRTEAVANSQTAALRPDEQFERVAATLKKRGRSRRSREDLTYNEADDDPYINPFSGRLSKRKMRNIFMSTRAPLYASGRSAMGANIIWEYKKFPGRTHRVIDDCMDLDFDDWGASFAAECDAAFNSFDLGLGFSSFAQPEPADARTVYGFYHTDEQRELAQALHDYSRIHAGSCAPIQIPAPVHSSLVGSHGDGTAGACPHYAADQSGSDASATMPPVDDTAWAMDTDAKAEGLDEPVPIVIDALEDAADSDVGDDTTAYSGSPHPSFTSLSSTLLDSTEAFCDSNFANDDKIGIIDGGFKVEAIVVDDDTDYMVLDYTAHSSDVDMAVIASRTKFNLPKVIKRMFKPVVAVPKRGLARLASRRASTLYDADDSRVHRTTAKASDSSSLSGH